MTASSDSPSPSADTHVAGVGPFITFRSYRHEGRRIIWQARQHRRGLFRLARALEHLPVPFWQTRRYNQIMGATFALGSSLFILGSLLSFLPQPGPTLITWTNITFFLGSIPFTLAAYMQHFQAANAGSFNPDANASAGSRARLHLLGWLPHDLGWLSTLTQFFGTLAFNINTFDAVIVTNPWYLEDVAIWIPDMVGSTLFLISAYLAFLETCHSYWKWQPRDLSWQVVFINLVGCVAFMVAACTAYFPSGGQNQEVALFSNSQTLLGALCFLIAALLSIRESQAADVA